MKKYILYAGWICFLSCGKPVDTDYPIKAVPISEVAIQDEFWTPKIRINADVSLPYALNQLKETGTLSNSSLYKLIEGASYIYSSDPDLELDKTMDTLIALIKTVQEPDGYLSRNSSLGQKVEPIKPQDRWKEVQNQSHELYYAGHLYEAAIAHNQATGKTSLLNIAIKNADLLVKVFGWGKIEKYPGHPEIELALSKLYRLTGNKSYLDLARFFLEVRGPDGSEYNQSHLRLADQKEAVGHAVRAIYLYSGLTEMASLTKEREYLNTVKQLWADIVETKMYISGDLGVHRSHESFGEAYELPNVTAYSETCGAVSNVHWNHRMFLLEGDAKYIDVLERSLYNGMLSGVSVGGDRFFYSNPLASMGQFQIQRASWYGVSCCPTNIIRTLPQIPGYIYAQQDQKLYINLFINSKTRVILPSGSFDVSMETGYPWNGKVNVNIDPEEDTRFELKIRLPGWLRPFPLQGNLYEYQDGMEERINILLNGSAVSYQMDKGFASIERNWKPGDVLELEFPMKVKRVISNDQVIDNQGRFAFERGPILYCLEEKDNGNLSIQNLFINKNTPVQAEFRTEFLKGSEILKTKGFFLDFTKKSFGAVLKDAEITAVPYYLWANRGPNEMMVWIPFDPASVVPKHELLPSIASKSKIQASPGVQYLDALNDSYPPEYGEEFEEINSLWQWPYRWRSDLFPRFEERGQWVQYNFSEPEAVTSVKIHWYDNSEQTMTTWYDGNPWLKHRIPESWKLYYLDKNESWQEVQTEGNYGIKAFQFNFLKFDSVETQSLKLELNPDKSAPAGIMEWVVN